MSRPKVTWNSPTKTVADRVPVRHSLKRGPLEPRKETVGRFWFKATAPRKGLRQVSARRKRELKEYSERRNAFLARPENQHCPVWAYLRIALKKGCGMGVTQEGKSIVTLGYTPLPRWKKTTDVHHKAGREGKLLNDERYWMAVSREGHDWIHANPNEARELGWILDL